MSKLFFITLICCILTGCATIGFRDVLIEDAINKNTLYIGIDKDNAARIVKLSPYWDKVYTSVDDKGEKIERWVLLGGPYRPTSEGRGYTLYFRDEKLFKIETWPSGSPPAE